jgi:transglutaminase-like putative cysteine protease
VKRLCVIAMLWVLGLPPLVARADNPKTVLDPNQPYQGAKSDPVTYQVDLQFVVTPPDHAKTLKVWVPLPPSNEAQEVSGRELSTFPLKVTPKIAKEPLYGNEFAYFEFDHPQGAQIVRHKFTVKTWEMRWNINPDRVTRVEKWPAAFDKYLRSERLIVVDDRFRDLAKQIIKLSKGQAQDLAAVMAWIQDNLKYDHANASLQASALHALEKKAGHCSDYHGLCTALGRSLGYPTRVAYGINPFPKNSPSHCKLEAFLPAYGWVAFDISETQQMILRIQNDPKLDAAKKEKLTRAATDRLLKGFRDNTWFMQTRGTDYDLVPPAGKRVAVVRTIYAEADGVALAEPDPANAKQREFAWMSVHHYQADRQVTYPFTDLSSLEK